MRSQHGLSAGPRIIMARSAMRFAALLHSLAHEVEVCLNRSCIKIVSLSTLY